MSDKPCFWLTYTGTECKLEKVKIFFTKKEALDHLLTFKSSYEQKYDGEVRLNGTTLTVTTKSGLVLNAGKTVLSQVE